MGTVRYDTLGVFVGPQTISGNVASGDITQLSRIQSTNYSIELERQSVIGLGSAFDNDGNVATPFVNLNFDYLVTNGENEKALGIVVDGIHGALVNTNSGERDFYLLVNKPADPMVLAIGNGILSNYSVSARLNEFMKASVQVRGFNIKLDEGTSGNAIPRVDLNGLGSDYTYTLPPLSAGVRDRAAGIIEDNYFIAPRHIRMNFPESAGFGTVLSGVSRSHIQEFNMSFGIDRHELVKMGDKYPFQRCLNLPMELTLSTTVLLENYTADNIQNYLCQRAHDIDIDILSNQCETYDDFWEEEEDTVKLKYMFKGMKLRSFSSSASIGDRKSVSLQWSVPIGHLQDLNRNLFISGDFGTYQFLTQSLYEQSGVSPVTELTYKRTKAQVEHADYDVEFLSNIQEPTGNPSYYQYYDGLISFAEESGVFGQDRTRSEFDWRSDSYSTVRSGVADSGVTDHFGTFTAKHPIGYPGLFDEWSGINPFYLKGTAIHDEPISIDFAGMPTWLHGAAGISTFLIDPNKPYFFNSANFSVAEWNFPTGVSTEIKMITRTNTLKRIYGLTVQTGPYNDFPVTLPKTFSRRASLFLQPYDERTVTYNGSNEISQIDNSTLIGQAFTAVGGSPEYSLNQQNGNSYITFNDGGYFEFTGDWMHDFRNFTCFAVFRPDSASSANAELFKFSNTDTSKAYYQNLAFCGRSGSSQHTNFYYRNPTTSGAYSETTKVPAMNTWTDDQWNIAEFTFDGATASGFNSGLYSGVSSFTISASGIFNKVEIGNGYRGDLGDIIIIPYKLHPTERYHVRELLKYKWGF